MVQPDSSDLECKKKMQKNWVLLVFLHTRTPKTIYIRNKHRSIENNHPG